VILFDLQREEEGEEEEDVGLLAHELVGLLNTEDDLDDALQLSVLLNRRD
jgi:hypothetical protein